MLLRDVDKQERGKPGASVLRAEGPHVPLSSWDAVSFHLQAW